MKPSFWATREFRWLLIIAIMAGATALVLVFEILPKLRREPPAQLGPEAYLPKSGETKLPDLDRLKEQLRSAKDLSPVEGLDDAHTALLEYVSALAPDLLAAEAKSVPYELLRKVPENFRGRPVSLTALLVDVNTVALPKKVGDLEFVHRAYLMDTSGHEGYVIDLIEKPPAFQQLDLISTEGIFLKMGSYESKKGFVMPAVLVGRSMRRAPERHEVSPLGGLDMRVAVAGVAVLSIGLLAFTVWIQRQSARRRLDLSLAPRPPGPIAWPPKTMPPKSPVGSASAPAPSDAPRHAITWKKAPKVRPAAPSVDLTVLSGRQRSYVGLALMTASIALVALLSVILWNRLRPRLPRQVDFAAESETAIHSAEEVRKEIRFVEERGWVRGGGLDTRDRELIRPRLKALERSAERLHELREAIRHDTSPAAQEAVARATAKLLEIQLWLADATDASADVPAGGQAGFYIPLELAKKRWQSARRDLAEIETAAPAQGAEGKEVLRRRAAEAKAALSAVKETFLGLEAYVKGRLPDVSPALPDLQALHDDLAQVELDQARAEKLAAPGN